MILGQLTMGARQTKNAPLTRGTTVTGVTVLSKVVQYGRMSQTADVTHHWSYVTIGGGLTLRNIPGAPSSWLPMAPEARWRKYC